VVVLKLRAVPAGMVTAIAPPRDAARSGEAGSAAWMVWGLGVGVWGLGFRGWGLGYRVERFREWGEGVECRV